MKTKKRNYFLRRKNVLRVKSAFFKKKRSNKALSTSKSDYNWKQEKVIRDYLEGKTEGAFYVPYDGYYYYEKSPSRLFYRLVPVLHKYPFALAWLNSCDELNKKHQKAYVCELCRRGVTLEIEMALIEHNMYGCSGCENLLIELHKHGHKFYPAALQRMKWRCPWVYQQIYPEEKK